MAHANRAHAYLSASGSYRWMNCTPSPRIESQFPELQSPDALTGTLAHEISEVLIDGFLGRISPAALKKRLKSLRASEYYYLGIEDDVLPYVDFIKELVEDTSFIHDSYEVVLEQKVDFSKYVPDGFGTADFGLHAGTTLEIADLKFGLGVPVSAVNNPALRLYALGLSDLLETGGAKIEKVIMHIIQPRLESRSSEEMDLKDLRDWAFKEIAPKAAKAYKGEGTPAPGEWCRFCKASGMCRAQYEEKISIPGDWLNPELLSVKELSEIWKKSEGLTRWVNDAKSQLYRLMVNGTEAPGLKLTKGRSSREWKDPEFTRAELVKVAIDPMEYETTSLMSPAALEKMPISKVLPNFKDLIKTNEGAPAIAHDYSPKQAFRTRTVFDDFGEGSED